MKKEVKGLFTNLDGTPVYKIENYDAMENFFMTITSSSDIWNFCWSQGGITAGRIDSNHAVFPYYTADKVHDARSYSGNYAGVAVKKDGKITLWEPFSYFNASPSIKKQMEGKSQFNIYKNYNGTKVWFEEVNNELKLLFRIGWTSSEQFGLVKSTVIKNLDSKAVELSLLDGAQNIMPACASSDLQNANSCLLDAYKKTDLDEKGNLALFALSSMLSDKAEPAEGLLANVSWFTCDDKIILSPDAPALFAASDRLMSASDFKSENVTKGVRSSCFICRKINLEKADSEKSMEKCFQIFDTSLSLAKIENLKVTIKDRKKARELLEADIKKCDDLMTEYLGAADGIQSTADTMNCVHHQENVMFNIMRGGIFCNQGKIDGQDFVRFIEQRNTGLVSRAKEIIESLGKKELSYTELFEAVDKKADAQLTRLFFEYMPLTFSRRHGDPSRPWNIFSIKLRDRDGNPILNYEGNWRDIFQNWEALAWSYPLYIKNMCVKFLNAMTADGFNPYKINRAGIDWEIPDPNNPWAFIGYWGDHQVIYFAKLLEFQYKTSRQNLLQNLDEKIYTSANVPYRIKSYADILKDPRNTIFFDRELSNELQKETKVRGSDAKLIQAADNNPYLVSFAAKALQIVITKISNLVPGGGIWLNTQRPEWNDANNALAGYGLSVVTLCYLYRYINLLKKIFNETKISDFTLPKAEKKALEALCSLYKNADLKKAAEDDKERKSFTDKAGIIFEAERTALYERGYSDGEEKISVKDVIAALESFNRLIELSIKMNRRDDGLYHSYNTVKISGDKMEIVYLQQMLEGQVAILSSDLLTPAEAEKLVEALQKSSMYEKRQNSFMLYPDKELPAFQNKNCVSADDAKALSDLIARTGSLYLEKDVNNVYHFNPDFKNSNFIKDFIKSQKKEYQPSASEEECLLALYEKTFNHQSFTGRSGTFYAYEGLGSIYWHMVSKLMLAVQENIFKAEKCGDKESLKKLTESYYAVQAGLGYKKSPELYGAFPQDPYSHTPNGQGAKQPGMTGQVKEEILTRFGELGVFVEDGKAGFMPVILKDSEIKDDKTLSFTWCGVPVKYSFASGKCQNLSDSCKAKISVNGKIRDGNTLTEEETKELFQRQGKITSIEVEF